MISSAAALKWLRLPAAEGIVFGPGLHSTIQFRKGIRCFTGWKPVPLEIP